MTGTRTSVPAELPDPPFPARSLHRRIEENLPLLVCGATLFVVAVFLLLSHSASRIGLLPSWSYLFAGGVIMLSGGSMATLYGAEQEPPRVSYATVDAEHILVSRVAWQRLNELAKAQTAVLASAPSTPLERSPTLSAPSPLTPSWSEGTEEPPETPAGAAGSAPSASEPSATTGSTENRPAPPPLQVPPPTLPLRPGAAAPRPKPGPIDVELEQLFRELNTQAASSPTGKAPAPPAAPARPACRACGKSVPPTGSRGSCVVCGESFCDTCSATNLALTPEGTVCDWCRKLTN
jgi:hypothetical protein